MKTFTKKEALERLPIIEAELQQLKKAINEPKDIIEMIQSYEDACEVIGEDPIESLPFKNPKNARQEAANAFHMLDIISEALLEGKKLDWTDSNVKKLYPYFNDYTPGSGFRFRDTDCGWTNASGGARLCVDTEAKARHFGSHPNFLPIWNKFLNPIK